MKRIFFSLVICLALLAMALPAYADTTYIVKPGETLSQIAVRFGVSVQAIVTANGLADPNLLFAGQSLIIPAQGTVPTAPTPTAVVASTGQTTYTVKPGDSLYRICNKYGVSLTALMAANKMTAYMIFPGQVLNIPGVASTTPAAATPAAPTATSPKVYTAGPLRADYFYMQTAPVGTDMPLWFGFKVTNVGGGDGSFGILSVFSDIYLYGQSWTNSGVKWPDSLEWRDHINISTPGVYPFYLAVCYASKDDCQRDGSLWQRLSDTVWVTVGDQYSYTGYTSSRGVAGNYFYVENMIARKGDPVWFDFKVTNTTGDDVYYGVLSALVKGGPLGQSWTSSRLTAGQSLEWRDHFLDLPVGTYAVSLGICYAGKDYCAGDGTLWDRLSNDVIVTVIDSN